MQAQKTNTRYRVAGPSSWELMSPSERSAWEAESAAVYQRMQQVPMNGVKTTPYSESREPISGALYEDTRVYTQNEGEEWKFWGVKEDGTTIEDFWAKHDPANTRGEDDSQFKAMDAELAAMLGTPDYPDTELPTTRKGLDAMIRLAEEIRERKMHEKQTRGKQTPKIKADHRVTKTRTPPPRLNTNTLRSLGSEKDVGQHTLAQAQNQTHGLPGSQKPKSSHVVTEASCPQKKTLGTMGARTSSAPPSKSKKLAKGALREPRPDALNSKEPDSLQDVRETEDAAPLHRLQCRLPKTVNPKSQRKGNIEKKSPPVRSNARVTKSKKKGKSSYAPTTHAMRTKARGSAQKLQLS